MADLFARLAARSRGQVTTVRPRPDAMYTGRPVVIGDAAPSADPLGDSWPASLADAPRNSPVPPYATPVGDATAVGDAESTTSPTQFDQHHNAEPIPGTHSTQGPLPMPRTSAQATLAQVIATLDAGSPAPVRENPTVQQTASTLADRTRRYPEPAGIGRRGRNDRDDRDVHVTIGELVIRGAPASPGPAPAAPAPPPAAPAGLTLHDYLRGRREPA